MMEVNETIENIREILLNDSFDNSIKLQALQNLKKIFKPPDKIFGQLKLEPLLQNARLSLESKTYDKDFLFSYGISLIKMFKRYSTINSEIIYQLEFILARLENEQNLTNDLIIKLWSQLDNGSIFNHSRILSASKQIIENRVLDLMDSTDNPQVEFLSKMASDSPTLFQSLISVFYEVLVRSNGHLKVFEVKKLFIQSVMKMCQKQGKNFLKLYPKNCRRLVALLIVPPEVYYEAKEDALKEVISLLMEVFRKDRKRALMLLSHYSEWVSVFKINSEHIEIS